MKTITVQKKGDGYIYDLFSEGGAIKRGVRCGLTPVAAATAITKMLAQAQDIALVAPTEIMELIPAHLRNNGNFDTPELGYTPKNLRNMRKQKGITQQQVADMTETNQRMVARWELELGSPNRSDMPYTKWKKLLDNLQKSEKKRL